MVTAGARAIGFGEYAAVTNMGPTHKKLGEFGVKIQEAFGWTRHAMLVYSDNKDANNDRMCFFAVEGLYMQLGERNISISNSGIEDDVDYKMLVRDIREGGRGEELHQDFLAL